MKPYKYGSSLLVISTDVWIYNQKDNFMILTKLILCSVLQVYFRPADFI